MQDLTGKITGSSLTAAEWNQLPQEVQNVITALGIPLGSGDLNQLGKAIAGYVANGTFYSDSGVADAYVLSTIGSKQAPTGYTDGFEINFVTANPNTGASTVNVAGLGVKSIKTSTGADPGASDIIGRAKFVFDAGNDWFELIPAEKEVASTAESQAGIVNDKIISPLRLHEAMIGGVTQSMTDVTGSRAANVIYTNTTGRAIWIAVIPEGNFSQSLFVDNLEVGRQPPTAGSDWGMTTIVPNGSTYELRGSVASIGSWVELR